MTASRIDVEALHGRRLPSSSCTRGEDGVARRVPARAPSARRARTTIRLWLRSSTVVTRASAGTDRDRPREGGLFRRRRLAADDLGDHACRDALHREHPCIVSASPGEGYAALRPRATPPCAARSARAAGSGIGDARSRRRMCAAMSRAEQRSGSVRSKPDIVASRLSRSDTPSATVPSGRAGRTCGLARRRAPDHGQRASPASRARRRRGRRPALSGSGHAPIRPRGIPANAARQGADRHCRTGR